VTPARIRHADRPVLVMLAAGMAKRYGGCKPLAPVGLHGEAVITAVLESGMRAVVTPGIFDLPGAGPGGTWLMVYLPSVPNLPK
jgi:hypothetical protein